MSKEIITSALKESLGVKQAILEDEGLVASIVDAAHLWITTFKSGGRVWFCGNGGSAADAQHIAAELSGRFYIDRTPLPAEALHVNTSYLTAVANDYGYEQVYKRMTQAVGRPGDVLVGLSTSGKSKYVLLAMQEAHRMGMATIALTGGSGGAMRENSDVLINVPSTDTARIQEAHITIGHILCQITEATIFT